MVFKRRDPRPFLRIAWELVFPPGGWRRAFRYVKFRVGRLPDTPERISRGVWAGVFTSFTPLFGLHFLAAALIARIMKGNILAALMATFFGNPLTYLPIGLIALETGHFLLGTEMDQSVERTLGGTFVEAWRELRHNIWALFTEDTADWDEIGVFFDDVFLPYLVGGLIPGAIAATICYMISVPLIRAYQKGRKRKIKAKFEAIKRVAVEEMKKELEDEQRAASAPGRQH